MRFTRHWFSFLMMAVAVSVWAAPPAGAADAKGSAASTTADRQARGEAATKAFMLGRYEEALATFLDLYVQSDGRPEYLRNIGRCQQKLKRYDRAIDSFKEYLRRAKHLSAEERKEVQGFISDMETTLANDSQGAKAATAGPSVAPVPAPAPAAPPPPPPAQAVAPPAGAPLQPAPPPVNGPPPAPAPAQAWGPPPGPSEPYPPPPQGQAPPPYDQGYAQQPPPPPLAPGPEAQPTVRHRSKLKTTGIVMVIAAGLLAVGGVIEALDAKSTYDSGTKAGCLTTGGTACNQKADSVASSILLSELLYVGAGLAGVTGLTMIIIAPSHPSEPSLGLAARWRF